MIDSGATGNFISSSFIAQHKIPTKLKNIPIPLFVIDGTPISSGGKITHSTMVMKVETLPPSKHFEPLSFDIISMKHEVILGLPWLQKHAPSILWDDLSLHFTSDFCKANCFEVDDSTQHKSIAAVSAQAPVSNKIYSPRPRYLRTLLPPKSVVLASNPTTVLSKSKSKSVVLAPKPATVSPKSKSVVLAPNPATVSPKSILRIRQDIPCTAQANFSKTQVSTPSPVLKGEMAVQLRTLSVATVLNQEPSPTAPSNQAPSPTESSNQVPSHTVSNQAPSPTEPSNQAPSPTAPSNQAPSHTATNQASSPIVHSKQDLRFADQQHYLQPDSNQELTLVTSTASKPSRVFEPVELDPNPQLYNSETLEKCLFASLESPDDIYEGDLEDELDASSSPVTALSEIPK